MRRLTYKLGKLGAQHQGQEGKNCNKCLLVRCEGGERCPAKTKSCNRCREFGHFSKSTFCKRKNKKVRKLQEEESSEEENVGRVETVAGVTKEGERDSRIMVSLGVTKQGESFKNVQIRVLADTGVRRTILNLGDWKKLGGGELKNTKLKFRPYGTNQYLPIRGRAAVRLKAEAGAVIDTEVYVN